MHLIVVSKKYNSVVMTGISRTSPKNSVFCRLNLNHVLHTVDKLQFLKKMLSSTAQQPWSEFWMFLTGKDRHPEFDRK